MHVDKTEGPQVGWACGRELATLGLVWSLCAAGVALRRARREIDGRTVEYALLKVHLVYDWDSWKGRST